MERMSRRRRDLAPRPILRRGPRPPRKDLVVTVVRTVPISSTREMRVSTSLSPHAQAVVVQSYVRDEPDDDMEPVGRAFTVFRAQLDDIVAALTEAGATLDASPITEVTHAHS